MTKNDKVTNSVDDVVLKLPPSSDKNRIGLIAVVCTELQDNTHLQHAEPRHVRGKKKKSFEHACKLILALQCDLKINTSFTTPSVFFLVGS